MRVARIFARELAEFARRREVLLLVFVAPVVLMLLIGNLRVREPMLRVAIIDAGAQSDVVSSGSAAGAGDQCTSTPGAGKPRASTQSGSSAAAWLESALREHSGVCVIIWPAAVADARTRSAREHVDVVAIADSEGGWRFYTPITNRYRLQFATAVVQDVALSIERAAKLQRELEIVGELGAALSEGPMKLEARVAAQGLVERLGRELRAGAALPTPVIGAATSSRLVAYYPPVSRIDRSTVPAFIGLVAVFLPFLVASASFAKEREARTLETLILAAGRSWTRIVAGKLVLPLCVAMVASLLLLVVARSAYGFGIKPELASTLAIQLLAALVSALLGIAVSTITRSQQEAYLTSAVYLIGLILVTGTIYPIDEASWPVVLVSYAFPLTFSGPPLEAYMMQGAAAAIVPWHFVGMAGQLAAAIVLCIAAFRRMRRTL